MKPFRLLPVFAALLVLPAIAAGEEADAPDTAASAEATPELREWQQEFLNLPADRRQEFAKHVTKARELFNQKRIFETVDELSKASAIFKNSPDIENLLGACQTEFRNFDKAMEHFKRADELNPNDSRILFNIAEIHFVTHNWDEAEKALAEVLTMVEGSNDLMLSRLVEFKLLLSKLKLGKTEEAEAMAEKYDEFDDSPYPYYAEAAISYEDGDEVAAQAAIARARRIFRRPEILSPWQDTMMEFGYIKSFFGGPLSEEEGGEE